MGSPSFPSPPAFSTSTRSQAEAQMRAAYPHAFTLSDWCDQMIRMCDDALRFDPLNNPEPAGYGPGSFYGYRRGPASLRHSIRELKRDAIAAALLDRSHSPIPQPTNYSSLSDSYTSGPGDITGSGLPGGYDFDITTPI